MEVVGDTRDPQTLLKSALRHAAMDGPLGCFLDKLWGLIPQCDGYMKAWIWKSFTEMNGHELTIVVKEGETVRKHPKPVAATLEQVDQEKTAIIIKQSIRRGFLCPRDTKELADSHYTLLEVIGTRREEGITVKGIDDVMDDFGKSFEGELYGAKSLIKGTSKLYPVVKTQTKQGFIDRPLRFADTSLLLRLSSQAEESKLLSERDFAAVTKDLLHLLNDGEADASKKHEKKIEFEEVQAELGLSYQDVLFFWKAVEASHADKNMPFLAQRNKTPKAPTFQLKRGFIYPEKGMPAVPFPAKSNNDTEETNKVKVENEEQEVRPAVTSLQQRWTLSAYRQLKELIRASGDKGISVQDIRIGLNLSQKPAEKMYNYAKVLPGICERTFQVAKSQTSKLCFRDALNITEERIPGERTPATKGKSRQVETATSIARLALLEKFVKDTRIAFFSDVNMMFIQRQKQGEGLADRKTQKKLIELLVSQGKVKTYTCKTQGKIKKPKKTEEETKGETAEGEKPKKKKANPDERDVVMCLDVSEEELKRWEEVQAKGKWRRHPDAVERKPKGEDISTATMLRTKALHIYIHGVLRHQNPEMKTGHGADFDMDRTVAGMRADFIINTFGYPAPSHYESLFANSQDPTKAMRTTFAGLRSQVKLTPAGSAAWELIIADVPNGVEPWYLKPMRRSMEIMVELGLLKRVKTAPVPPETPGIIPPFKLGCYHQNAEYVPLGTSGPPLPIRTREECSYFWTVVEACSEERRQRKLVENRDEMDVKGGGSSTPPVWERVPELLELASWAPQREGNKRSKKKITFRAEDRAVMAAAEGVLGSGWYIARPLTSVDHLHESEMLLKKLAEAAAECGIPLDQAKDRVVKLAKSLKTGKHKSRDSAALSSGTEYLSATDVVALAQSRGTHPVSRWLFTPKEEAAVIAMKQAVTMGQYMDAEVTENIKESLSRFDIDSLVKALLFLWKHGGASPLEAGSINEQQAPQWVREEVSTLMTGREGKRFTLNMSASTMVTSDTVDIFPANFPRNFVSGANIFENALHDDTKMNEDLSMLWSKGGGQLCASLSAAGRGEVRMRLEVPTAGEENMEERPRKRSRKRAKGDNDADPQAVDLSRFQVVIDKLIAKHEQNNTYTPMDVDTNTETDSNLDAEIVQKVLETVQGGDMDGVPESLIIASLGVDPLPYLNKLQSEEKVIRVLCLEHIRWVDASKSSWWTMKPLRSGKPVGSDVIPTSLHRLGATLPWAVLPDGGFLISLRRQVVGFLLEHCGTTVHALCADQPVLTHMEAEEVLRELVDAEVVVSYDAMEEMSWAGEAGKAVKCYSATGDCLRNLLKLENRA